MYFLVLHFDGIQTPFIRRNPSLVPTLSIMTTKWFMLMKDYMRNIRKFLVVLSSGLHR